jgi:thymidine phosphorylase
MSQHADLKAIESVRLKSSDNELRDLIQSFRGERRECVESIACLAAVIASSGKLLNFEPQLVADVASTGGPSSLSTLLAPLYLRVGGAVVPCLGVPGRPAGGVDCLAQIPNYSINLSAQQVVAVIHRCGYAHFHAQGDLAPLDARLFEFRKRVGALPVPSLVTASILAKKLAVGVGRVGLDIRVAPHGNFGTSQESARENARIFSRVSARLNLRATTFLTDARFPYQPFIGRGEALIALDNLFQGKACDWLSQHSESCRKLAAACVPSPVKERIIHAPISQLATAFFDNLSAQGSSEAEFRSFVAHARKAHIGEIFSTRAGFVHYNLEQIRTILTKWQAIYQSPVYPFADPVGLMLDVRAGSWVSRGTRLATLRAPAGLLPRVIRSLSNSMADVSEIPFELGVEQVHG